MVVYCTSLAKFHCSPLAACLFAASEAHCQVPCGDVPSSEIKPISL